MNIRISRRNMPGLALGLSCLSILCLGGSAVGQGSPDIVWRKGVHTDSVTAVACSPDSKLIASSSFDG
ncbi:MAG: WD40 repeat domain-containing protein, partial [Verrucomicrobiota bacterium]|nr:WD40 repeat domain-containing protein [Verrucomicrobiota bacterium]